jgi:hypothetical protein
MGTLRRRRVGFAMAVLTFLLTSISPSGAQEAPPPDLSSRGALAPAQRIEANKAPSSSLAKTDSTLLARNDAGSTRVMIKFDYDSVATYRGGVDGLAATSRRSPAPSSPAAPRPNGPTGPTSTASGPTS